MKDYDALDVFIFVVMGGTVILLISLILAGIFAIVKEASCYNLPLNEFYESEMCEVYR